MRAGKITAQGSPDEIRTAHDGYTQELLNAAEIRSPMAAVQSY